MDFTKAIIPLALRASESMAHSRLLHKFLGNFLATFGLSSNFWATYGLEHFFRQLLVFRAFFRQLFSIRENISFLSDKNLFFMHFLSDKTNKYPF